MIGGVLWAPGYTGAFLGSRAGSTGVKAESRFEQRSGQPNPTTSVRRASLICPPCAGGRIHSCAPHARRREVATGQLAQGNQGTPDGPLCCHARAHCGCPAPTDRPAGAQHMPGEETWLVGEHRSNIIYPICPRTPQSRLSRARSRRAGSANKHISNSRKNWDWITSRADPGPDFSAMP